MVAIQQRFSTIIIFDSNFCQNNAWTKLILIDFQFMQLLTMQLVLMCFSILVGSFPHLDMLL